MKATENEERPKRKELTEAQVQGFVILYDLALAFCKRHNIPLPEPEQ